ncbi:VOC family protein [Amnibacterium flavum]|uniref:VOC family protein n=1 Tax=Amnibacterium flavum TaxID=2173173 RepID=UPI0014037122|nr:VOC family protein [Amnibacterium flavum]
MIETLTRLHWMDVISTDLTRTAEFYRSVFGWRMDDAIEHNGLPYHLLRDADGTVVAGAEEIPPHKGPSTWTLYVGTADTAALFRRSVDAGGRIGHEPYPLSGWGSLAYVLAPDGTGLGVAETSPPLGGATGAGRLIGAELQTPDPDATGKFLEQALGWRPRTGAIGGVRFDAGGVDARVLRGSGGAWIPVLAATTYAETVDAVIRDGGVCERRSDGTVLARDPFGAAFVLREPTAVLPTGSAG